MRVALGIEYDGRDFNGWQRQRGARTVQAVVESALAGVADEVVDVICAGRTDSGVHACQQVVHFDTNAERSSRAWVLGANAALPNDVSILWAQDVPAAFHARFSALSRAYNYIIFNRQARPALWHGKVTWECRPLDPLAMREAARAWLGEHDFSAFRAKGCQAAHPIREVHEFNVTAADGFVILSIRANAFLQHMVRNFAGVLMDIGMGRHSPSWAAELLHGRQRERGGVTAPAAGLYLTEVRYPPIFGLPAADRTSAQLPGYRGISFTPRS